MSTVIDKIEKTIKTSDTKASYKSVPMRKDFASQKEIDTVLKFIPVLPVHR